MREGGTTFTFVDDGIEAALRQARSAAGGKDVRISGGADTIRQFLEAKLVDELTIHLAPVILGAGVRLFDRIRPTDLDVTPESVTGSPLVTHLTYKVA